MSYSRICPVCGKTFSTSDKRKKRCSRKCFCKLQSKLFHNRVILVCDTCGNTYEQVPSLAKTSHYCSRKCHNMGQSVKIELHCKVCGKVFRRIPSRKGEYCSYECMGKDDRKRITKVCIVCGKSFETTPQYEHIRLCCSRACSSIYRKRGKTLHICLHCGKEYWVSPSATEGTTYCSMACRILHEGPNGLETKVHIALKELGIVFIPEYKIGHFRIDCFVQNLKLAIEVDGDYWHSLPAQIERDHRKDLFLHEHDIHVIRIKQCEINQTTHLAQLILEKINSISL